MAKKRVYELARELNLESKALVAKIIELGIEVASHQSTLTDAQAAKIKEKLGGAVSAKPKVVVRRRRKKAEPDPEVAVADEKAEELKSDGLKDKVNESALLSSDEKPTSLEDIPANEETSSIGAEDSVKKVEADAEVSVGVTDSKKDDDTSNDDVSNSGRRLSKATQALMSARNKEKKSDSSFQAAKIVRRSETTSNKTSETGRYSLKGSGEKSEAVAFDPTNDSVGSSFKSRGSDQKRKSSYETEPERVRAPLKKDKRSQITTRDLLSNYGSEDGEASFRKGKKRTVYTCLLYTSPSPRDLSTSRMPSSA